MKTTYSLVDSIIITGPTTTGKSEVAVQVARRLNGAIINTDDYYFFASKYLHIGLGLSLEEPAQDIPHFLYGALDIEHSKPEPEIFLRLIQNAADEAIKKGYRPIFQGCSFYLNSALIKLISTRNVFALSLKRQDLKQRINNRISEMCKEGLIEEVDQIIKAGLHHSWIVEGGAIYYPSVEYCLGLIDQKEMASKIAEAIEGIAIQQEEKYGNISQIRWIDSASTSGQTADKIIDSLV